ncbi:MetQ/NlpA family ABC transporter substrate-binding protein [Salirhabdus sp. Marseille-P4669]|uniref:MetQ/NlpA family ABC transporter substrate-binding protein n=1 Tax=Salirhabdus sp. Marseille-P4669 TaxID=2042310 RepID=UPI000C79C6CC|nr:MetQ/NlpA family ABC transporter substrate-binding protein [Salirhabdus sp. Marseille-P4669]
MKKYLGLLVTALLITFLAACGSSEKEDGNGSDDSKTITIGAAVIPHSEVLEKAKPILEEKGIELVIEEYDDYILPNRDLEEDRLDANYFQHTPYLEGQIEEFGYDFVSLGGIHIEPIGIYSKSVSSVEEIPEGTVVIMSSSEADRGRILSLLARDGVITLKEGTDNLTADFDDIAENPLNLEFDDSIEPALLPEYYNREEDALVAINTNYAIEAGLLPTEDALLLEGSESPYANLIVTKSENKDNEALQTLVEVLRSEEIQTFMKEEYNGAIVPVSE